MRNPTLDWGLMRELDAGGVRVESHGIAHRPLAEVTPRRGRARDRRLEARLEGELAARSAPTPTSRAPRRTSTRCTRASSSRPGTRSRSPRSRAANGTGTNPFRLGRYNVEPYPSRTFDLVLSGACDLISLKDTVAGTHARRLFNQALGTSTR